MFDYSIKNRTSQSNCLSVSWKSHVYRVSFITNTKLERVQLSFFYIDWRQLQKSIAKFNFSVKCLRLLLFLSLPRGRSLWVEDNSPHVKESGFRNPENFFIWNPESWKFLLVESGILGLGIRNTGVGIRNPTNNSNPESKFHWKRSGIQ